MTDNRETFLVTGGTGNIGAAFVHLLARDARQPIVRVATRSPAGAAARLLQAFNPETVQPVAFDAGDPAVCARALAGVTRVLIIAPFGGDMAGWHQRVAGLVRESGTCEHIVKVSVTGARGPGHDPPPGRIPLAHWQGEEALRQSGVPCTFIRPTIFMQHFLDVPALYVAGDDRFYLPIGTARVAFLDCRDIAEAAAAVLWLDPAGRAAYNGAAFELTGPSAVTGAEMADALSWAAGRRIEHVDGEGAFVEHARSAGASDLIKGVYAEAAGGWFSRVDHGPFAALTGHLPTSFARFALDHAAHFAARP